MRIISAVVAALLLTGSTLAAPDLKVPDKVAAKTGRMVKIQLTTNAIAIRWVACGDVDLIPSESGRWAIFLAPTAGDYRVVVIASDKVGDLADATCVVTVTGADPVPPVPIPPGPGPEPGPTPTPITKAWVVIVEDTGAPPEARGKFYAHRGLASYLKSKGWVMRAVSKNSTSRDTAPYIARAKGKSIPQSYIVDQAGNILYEAGLDYDPVKFLSICRKIGG